MAILEEDPGSIGESDERPTASPIPGDEQTRRRDPILLTGATGYVGGRLLKALEAQGHNVRCMVRQPSRLIARMGPRTEVVAGDVLDPASLCAALAGVDVAYYLVHSMGSSGSFEDLDRDGARNFARAARGAGIHRIVYLGGLGGSASGLSAHLRSRHEVGEILRDSGVQVIEFRASIVIGSGSLSFEMIRALVERLPVMVTPRWVTTRAQPIAIADLLDYLIAAIDLPIQESKIFAIGGADRVSYGDIMKEYARQRGLRRTMIPVPVLTPRLSSLWLGFVTPLYARIGRKLVDSLRHPTVVDDEEAARAFPIRPMGMPDAVRAALRNEDHEIAETRWSDALSSAGSLRAWSGVRFGSRIIDSRVIEIPVDSATAFAPIRRLGGKSGWYFGNWLWQVRGFLDLVVGGVGMRRGRPDPEWLKPGDTLDCWRVEEIEPDHRLRLTAEMKLPGRAWLEFEVREAQTIDGTRSTIRQTALFDPLGLGGLAYWYALYPFHEIVFAGMLRGIARAAFPAGAASPAKITYPKGK
jgi:uncharacterized protein YbjT (DUF2867 family)